MGTDKPSRYTIRILFDCADQCKASLVTYQGALLNKRKLQRFQFCAIEEPASRCLRTRTAVYASSWPERDWL